jgi:hypothetical protein
MANPRLNRALLASALAMLGLAGPSQAYYSASATLDVAGNNASAVAYAAVQCYDNGAGPPDHLAAAVQDLSAPVSGLFLSLHIFKDTQMTTVTDAAAGDGGFSPVAVLAGGPGTYYLSLRKTSQGARAFNIGWECQTADNVGTGTGITVLQFQ